MLLVSLLNISSLREETLVTALLEEHSYLPFIIVHVIQECIPDNDLVKLNDFLLLLNNLLEASNQEMDNEVLVKLLD